MESIEAKEEQQEAKLTDMTKKNTDVQAIKYKLRKTLLKTKILNKKKKKKKKNLERYKQNMKMKE